MCKGVFLTRVAGGVADAVPKTGAKGGHVGLSCGPMADSLIRVEGLEKTFRQGFLMRRVAAVRGISFKVERGAVFGFLGPNGAGKTTTIKILMGLIAATRGEAFLFGLPVSTTKARTKVGFLPENPYIYPYLTPLEFVRLCAGLSGVERHLVETRSMEVLERVGMGHAAERPVRRLSKGMLQRTGLAAALVGEPELLVLDEPMSGLDPIGRKEVRELILAEQHRGRTIFFSSHILSDVETLCDQVAILQAGKVVVSGRLDELLGRDTNCTEVVFGSVPSGEVDGLCRAFDVVREVAGRVVVSVDGQSKLDEVLRYGLSRGLSVIEVSPRQETLEDLFMRHNLGQHVEGGTGFGEVGERRVTASPGDLGAASDQGSSTHHATTT